ncbi:MAG: ATP-binding protein [Bacteroidota bacterium]
MKNYFQQNRLAAKLIISLTVLIIVAEGISGFITIKTQERQLLNAMVTGADQLSRGITSATWHAMLADRRDDAYTVMNTIALKQGIERIRIFNKEGRVMFSTTSGENLQVDKKAEACYFCHASDQPLVKVDVPSRARIYRAPSGIRTLALVTPIYNEPSCSQADCHAHPANVKVLGVLDVAFSLEQVDNEKVAMEERVFLMAGVHILLVGVFIVLFSRHFVDIPIRKLIEGTRKVSEMQLDTPIEINTTGEIGQLARSFDVMRERLRIALAELNQFTDRLETKVAERSEQLRIAHQKLLQSDRLASLGQLSASVAHEINNPISGVLNLSMLMQRIITAKGLPSERVEEVRKYLDQVVNETSRVGRIVANLLAFSRRSKPHRANINLNSVIRSTLIIVNHKLKLMNVEVKLCLAEDLPTIPCDTSQMQQVLLNLVMNAAEASQNKVGPVVTIVTRYDQERVTLEVKDNGDGISPEHLNKIFDPFFTTKGEGKGVGLGLSVVYGIVEAHHGEIEAASTVGEGSTFTVTIPRTDGLTENSGVSQTNGQPERSV